LSPTRRSSATIRSDQIEYAFVEDQAIALLALSVGPYLIECKLVLPRQKWPCGIKLKLDSTNFNPSTGRRRPSWKLVVGELAVDFPCALRAHQIIDFSMGLALRARLGVGRDLSLVDAEQSVELFFR